MKKTFWISVVALWLLVVTILTNLTEDVVNSEQIINFDKYFSTLFLSWRSSLGVNIFSVITFLGNLEFVLPLIIIVILGLIYKKYQNYIWPFIFTILSAESVTFVGKILVHRFRPENGAIVETDFSFPSGHATIVVALYGFLSYILFKKTAKKSVFVGALIIILLVGFSRLYLGVHYVSDVIAGYLVGLLALIAGLSLSIKSNQKLKLK
jgi:membrane-associated phospholipid phosphatase